MDEVTLHFPEADTEPLRLSPGSHRIGWTGGRLGVVADASPAVLVIRAQVRDLWLDVVAQADVCIHVNGRRVYRIAHLRCGDVLHVESAALRLLAPSPPPRPAPEPARGSMPDARCRVLRGLGGQYHGRSFTLTRPRWAGRSARADIVLDEPGWAERQVNFEPQGAQLLVRNLGAPEQCVLNGHPLREAVMVAGDQLVLGGRHRFVLEVPQAAGAPSLPPPEQRPPAPAPHSRATWPLWLLAAAVLLAAALSGLLLLAPTQ